MIKAKDHFHGSDLEKIEKKYGINKNEIISFSANVNPLGISPKIKEGIIEKIDAITSYPDREYTSLRQSIAAYCQCSPDQVIVGNGCSELISLFIQIIKPKNTILLGPTYSEYERELNLIQCQIHHYFLNEKEDFIINMSDFISHISPNQDMVILCNPNNPTSSFIQPEQLTELLEYCNKHNIFVMVDETYIEFVANTNKISAISLTDKYDNLIVLRGTSKFFAAPGLRLGYAITGNHSFITSVNTNKNPWMINSLAGIAGEIMFSDKEYIQKTKDLIDSERKKLFELFQNSTRFKAYYPYANFMLLKILDSNINSFDLFEKAICEKLMIRDCSSFITFQDRYIRFCFMLPEDNIRLANCLLSKI